MQHKTDKSPVDHGFSVFGVQLIPGVGKMKKDALVEALSHPMG
jgi:hypothetical protein